MPQVCGSLQPTQASCGAPAVTGACDIDQQLGHLFDIYVCLLPLT